MITRHQYLDKYPISGESEKLIVGTIHPHDYEDFDVRFFYGNVNSLWKILNKSFPNEISSSGKIDIEGILRFLEKHKISMSDTIIECERIHPTALDRDLRPIQLNTAIIEQVRNSKITEIMFTSGFGKNNAFKLFYENILKQKVTQEIKENRGVTLDETFFGRKIKLTVLYSPSGAANTGLVRSRLYLQNAEKYQGRKTPVQDFKVDYYRQMFMSVI